MPLVALALVVPLPTAAAAPPVIPQYSFTTPTANGPKPVRIDSQPEGESGDLLRAIGTSPDLGAPAVAPKATAPQTDQDSPSFAGAVVDSAGAGPALALLAGLAAIAGLMTSVFLSSRRKDQAGTQ